MLRKSTPGDLSVNVVNKIDQENDENGLDGHYPRIPKEAQQNASPT